MKLSERFTHQTKKKGVLARRPEATGTLARRWKRALETEKSERVSGAGIKMGDLLQCSNCGTCASKFG